MRIPKPSNMGFFLLGRLYALIGRYIVDARSDVAAGTSQKVSYLRDTYNKAFTASHDAWP